MDKLENRICRETNTSGIQSFFGIAISTIM